MASQQHHPEDPEASGFSDPTSGVWSRYAVASPPNPWDGSRLRRTRPRDRGRILALLVLILGLFILGAAVLHAQQVSSADLATEPGLTTAPPPPPETSVIVETSTVVIVSSAAPEPSPVISEVATEDTAVGTPEMIAAPADLSTPPVSTYRAPASAQQCAANVNWRIFSATEVTSCPFAENVAITMKPHAGSAVAHQIQVWSPVTGQEYRVDCQPMGQGSFRCEGGADARVLLEHRHDLRPGH